jgi:hypothetical protein
MAERALIKTPSSIGSRLEGYLKPDFSIRVPAAILRFKVEVAVSII